MDCSLPGSSVRGIFQARTLEWVAISLPWGSARLRKGTRGLLHHRRIPALQVDSLPTEAGDGLDASFSSLAPDSPATVAPTRACPIERVCRQDVCQHFTALIIDKVY